MKNVKTLARNRVELTQNVERSVIRQCVFVVPVIQEILSRNARPTLVRTVRLAIIIHFDSTINFSTSVKIVPERVNPCLPSPCGSNAQCTERNGAGSCKCLPNYIGNPYEGCRPECTLNSDCASDTTCVNLKCIDPCPGTCGTNAECYVVNHTPICSCYPSYTGDPYRFCSPQPLGEI